jgi:hypothetical protein
MQWGMGINGCEFDFDCPIAPSEGLDAATGHLVKLGYVLKKRKAGQVHLVFKGRWLKGRHHLYITSNLQSLHFEFTTGAIASYWIPSERIAVQKRAEAATQAAIALAHPVSDPFRTPDRDPAPEGKARCRYCDSLYGWEDPTCSACGGLRREEDQ